MVAKNPKSKCFLDRHCRKKRYMSFVTRYYLATQGCRHCKKIIYYVIVIIVLCAHNIIMSFCYNHRLMFYLDSIVSTNLFSSSGFNHNFLAKTVLWQEVNDHDNALWSALTSVISAQSPMVYWLILYRSF